MNCYGLFANLSQDLTKLNERAITQENRNSHKSEIKEKIVRLEGEIGNLKVVLGERKKELNRKIQLHYEEYLKKIYEAYPPVDDVYEYAGKVYGEEGKETYVKKTALFGEIDMTDIEGFGYNFSLFSSKLEKYCEERKKCYEEKKGEYGIPKFTDLVKLGDWLKECGEYDKFFYVFKEYIVRILDFGKGIEKSSSCKMNILTFMRNLAQLADNGRGVNDSDAVAKCRYDVGYIKTELIKKEALLGELNKELEQYV